jgi:hypothetical protein
VRRDLGDVLVAEEQLSPRRIVDPADEVEDRRLPGAIGPDDGEDLARLHLEAHPVERLDPAEVDGELARREERHRKRSDRMYVFWRLNVARL